MTTTSYRSRSAVGVRHLFSVEALLCCPVVSWCTRNDDNDILPQPLGGGCSSPFSVKALLCGPVVSWCTRNDDNDILPQPFGGGCSSLFSVEAILCCPVAFGCTRNDDNDILPQSARRWVFVTYFPLRHYSAVRSCLVHADDDNDILPKPFGGGCSSFFPSRQYSAVRSCLGARGTMTTTCYRVRAAVGVRHLFSVESLLCCPVVSWCTRNDGNDILPQPLGGGCSSFFPSRPYSAVRSRLRANGTMTTTSYRSRSAVGVRHLFPSRHYSAVRSGLGARGKMSTTSYRSRMAVGVRHLFSVEALLCCPVAFGCTRNDDNDILPQPRGGGCSSPFFRRVTTLLSGRVLVHAER
ncbi:uncharacterized protein TNCV_2163191 [Trichonephila clavipes]|nr:uncharacterized protein TNCV_2163191 [Trichonephila clavipes]